MSLMCDSINKVFFFLDLFIASNPFSHNKPNASSGLLKYLGLGIPFVKKIQFEKYRIDPQLKVYLCVSSFNFTHGGCREESG